MSGKGAPGPAAVTGEGHPVDEAVVIRNDEFSTAE